MLVGDATGGAVEDVLVAVLDPPVPVVAQEFPRDPAVRGALSVRRPRNERLVNEYREGIEPAGPGEVTVVPDDLPAGSISATRAQIVDGWVPQ